MYPTLVIVACVLGGILYACLRHFFGQAIRHYGKRAFGPSFQVRIVGFHLRDVMFRMCFKGLPVRVRVQKISLVPSFSSSTADTPGRSFTITLQIESVHAQVEMDGESTRDSDGGKSNSDALPIENIELLNSHTLGPVLHLLRSFLSTIVRYVRLIAGPAMLSRISLLVRDYQLEVFSPHDSCVVLSSTKGLLLRGRPTPTPRSTPTSDMSSPLHITISGHDGGGQFVPVYVHLVEEQQPNLRTTTSPMSRLTLRDSDILATLEWGEVCVQGLYTSRGNRNEPDRTIPNTKVTICLGMFRWHHVAQLVNYRRGHRGRSGSRSRSAYDEATVTPPSRKKAALPRGLVECDFEVSIQKTEVTIARGQEEGPTGVFHAEGVSMDIHSSTVLSSLNRTSSQSTSHDHLVTLVTTKATACGFALGDEAFANLGPSELESRIHTNEDRTISTISLSLDGENAQLVYSRDAMVKLKRWVRHVLATTPTDARSRPDNPTHPTTTATIDAVNMDTIKDESHVPSPAKLLHQELISRGVDVEVVFGLEIRSGSIVFPDAKTTASVELWRTSCTYGRDTSYHVSLESQMSLLLLVGESEHGAESDDPGPRIDRILSSSNCSGSTKIDVHTDPFQVVIKSPEIVFDDLILDLTPQTVDSLSSMAKTLSSRGRRVRAMTVDENSSVDGESGYRPILLQDPIHLELGAAITNFHTSEHVRAAQVLVQSFKTSLYPSGKASANLGVIEICATDQREPLMSVDCVVCEREGGFLDITIPSVTLAVSPVEHVAVYGCLFAIYDRLLANKQKACSPPEVGPEHKATFGRGSMTRIVVRHIHVTSLSQTGSEVVLTIGRTSFARMNGTHVVAAEDLKVAIGAVTTLAHVKGIAGCKGRQALIPTSIASFVQDFVLHSSSLVDDHEQGGDMLLGADFDGVSVTLPHEPQWSIDFAAHVGQWTTVISDLNRGHISHRERRQKQAGASLLEVVLTVRGFDLRVEDNPFEVQLALNYQLHRDEYYQRHKREVAVFERLESAGRPSAAKILAVKERLDKENSSLYCDRVKNLKQVHALRKDMMTLTLPTLVATLKPQGPNRVVSVQVPEGVKVLIRDYAYPILTIADMDTRLESAYDNGTISGVNITLGTTTLSFGSSYTPACMAITKNIGQIVEVVRRIGTCQAAPKHPSEPKSSRTRPLVVVSAPMFTMNMLPSHRNPHDRLNVIPMRIRDFNLRSEQGSYRASVQGIDVCGEAGRHPWPKTGISLSTMSLAINTPMNPNEGIIVSVGPPSTDVEEPCDRITGTVHIRFISTFIESVSMIASATRDIHRTLVSLKGERGDKPVHQANAVASPGRIELNGVLSQCEISVLGSFDGEFGLHFVAHDGRVSGSTTTKLNPRELSASFSSIKLSFNDRIVNSDDSVHGNGEGIASTSHSLVDTGVISLFCHNVDEGPSYELSINDLRAEASRRVKVACLDWYAVYKAMNKTVRQNSVMDDNSNETKAKKTPLTVVLHRPQVRVEGASSLARLWLVSKTMTATFDLKSKNGDLQGHSAQLFSIPPALDCTGDDTLGWVPMLMIADPDESKHDVFKRLFEPFDLSFALSTSSGSQVDVCVPKLKTYLEAHHLQALIAAFKMITSRVPRTFHLPIAPITADILEAGELPAGIQASRHLTETLDGQNPGMLPSSVTEDVTSLQLLEADLTFLDRIETDAEFDREAVHQANFGARRCTMAIRSELSKPRGKNDPKGSGNTSKVTYKLGKLNWFLTQGQVPFLELKVESFAGHRNRLPDGSGTTSLEVDFIVLDTVASRKVHAHRVIGPYFGTTDQGTTVSHGNSYNIQMLKLEADVTKPVGGVTVYSRWQLSTFPLRIEITQDEYKNVYRYVFPNRDDSKAILVNEASHIRNESSQLEALHQGLAASTSTSDLTTTASSEPEAAETIEELRHSRAKNSVFFRQFQIDSNKVCVTYSSDGKSPTFSEWVVQVPTVRFENLTASWKKCYSRVKKAITVSLVKQSATKAVPAAWQLLRNAVTSADIEMDTQQTEASSSDTRDKRGQATVAEPMDRRALLLGSQAESGRENEKLLLGSTATYTPPIPLHEPGDGDDEDHDIVTDEARAFLARAFGGGTT